MRIVTCYAIPYTLQRCRPDRSYFGNYAVNSANLTYNIGTMRTHFVMWWFRCSPALSITA